MRGFKGFQQSLRGVFFVILTFCEDWKSVRFRHISREILLLTGLFLFLPQVLAGCCVSEATLLQNTQYEGTLRIGIDSDFAPFTYIGEDGEYTGLDIALAREVCKRMNYELIIVPIQWDEKEQCIEDGTVDCIWSCLTMEGRENQYSFTTAYLKNEQYFVVAADSPIQSLSELTGKNVAIQYATIAQQLLTKEYGDFSAEFSHLYLLQDKDTLIMYLVTGEADAVLVDVGVAREIQKDYPEGYRILSASMSNGEVAVGFAPNREDLRDQVNLVLFDMFQDGTYEAIVNSFGMGDYICN